MSQNAHNAIRQTQQAAYELELVGWSIGGVAPLPTGFSEIRMNFFQPQGKPGLTFPTVERANIGESQLPANTVAKVKIWREPANPLDPWEAIPIDIIQVNPTYITVYTVDSMNPGAYVYVIEADALKSIAGISNQQVTSSFVVYS